MLRSLHLDLVRILACVMIVLMHSPMAMTEQYGPLLSGLSYVTAPGIGLFFMVSGALLIRSPKGDTEFCYSEFLKKRFSKIIWPTLFWAVVGYTLQWLGIKNVENGILWFMYALSGLYLITPILIRWINQASQNEILFYLALWAISLCYPYLKSCFALSESVSSWIYYFHGYAGYFVLGAYLSRYKIGKKLGFGMSVAFALFSLVLPILNILLHWNVDFYSWFWYLSMAVALQCIGWWKLIELHASCFERFRIPITYMSKLSFGIYLVHILIMRNILWQMNWMQEMTGIMQIIICSAMTFCLSLILCWGLSKLRFSKYIIGI